MGENVQRNISQSIYTQFVRHNLCFRPLKLHGAQRRNHQRLFLSLSLRSNSFVWWELSRLKRAVSLLFFFRSFRDVLNISEPGVPSPQTKDIQF